jgi:L-threonylcarbamoyladenylate synthase
MRTVCLKVDSASPDPGPIEQGAALLRNGGLVGFPTETVYGLGANALDPAAVARIFQAKGRPATNPVIVHVADADSARILVQEWPAAAARLAERFWPGPLTLVLPRSSRVPDIVTAGGPTVAVRVPAHPVALALVRAAGIPVAAPSANPSSRLSPTLADHVMRGLAGRIDLVLDGGPTPGGIESTVLDLASDPPAVLRPGPVSREEIEAVIGGLRREGAAGSAGALRSPGMLRRHYAPQARLVVAEDAVGEAQRLEAAGMRVAVLARSAAGSGWTGGVVRMPADASAYAARLYAALHELDEAGFDAVVVEAPPATAEWAAVRDRLARASA